MSDSEAAASDADWLVGGEGREAVSAVARALEQRARELSILSGLRARGLSAERSALVISCGRARVKAGRLGLDERLLFTDEALQQASPPVSAAWRARRFEGRAEVVDLCAGGGIDSLALADVAGQVVAVDVDWVRATLLRHNATVREAPVRVVRGDVLRAPVDLRRRAVHADPSRRSSRRAARPAEYHPPLAALQAVLRDCEGSCALASPALALDAPEVGDREVELIQIGRTLTQAALWAGDLARAPRARTATLLPAGHTVTVTEPARAPVAAQGAFLLSAQPAAIRAGYHEVLAIEHGAWRLPGRALLSTNDEPPPSPWWSRWAVEADLPLRARQMKAWLRAAGDLPLEIELHGVDATVESLLDSLGRIARGPNGRRLFAVRVGRSDRALFCRPIDAGAAGLRPEIAPAR